MLYDKILKEYQKLKQQINLLEKKLQTYPDGKLICCHNNNHCKWYHSDGHTKRYIKKSNRLFAEKLALKKYLSCVLNNLSQEKTALEFYLRHHKDNSEKLNSFFESTSGYKELLSPYFKPQSIELAEWMDSTYERNPKKPEQLTVQTEAGHFVRSKSEAMIDHFLYTNQIPYRYECSLHLNDVILYPDFTIRHPKTGQVFYWEHFGLMDNPTYCQKVASKIQLYSTNGIIPTHQLITTYETKSLPLSTHEIQQTIEKYFL